MSELMTPMSFEHLLNWILKEHKQYGTVFGEHDPYVADSKNNREIFGRALETPIGPAAGAITVSGLQSYMCHRQWKNISKHGSY